MPQYVTLKTSELSKFEVDPDKMGDLEKALAKRLKCKKVTCEVVAGGKAVKISTADPELGPEDIKKRIK